MFKITAHQLDNLRAQRRAQFVRSVAARLGRRFPDAMDQNCRTLEALVEDAIELGAGFGVTSSYDVRRFAECLLIYGAGFPDVPGQEWAAKILRDPARSGRAKMTAISNYETFSMRTRG